MPQYVVQSIPVRQNNRTPAVPTPIAFVAPTPAPAPYTVYPGFNRPVASAPARAPAAIPIPFGYTQTATMYPAPPARPTTAYAQPLSQRQFNMLGFAQQYLGQPGYVPNIGGDGSFKYVNDIGATLAKRAEKNQPMLGAWTDMYF